MSQFLICIDQQCPYQRVIANWNDQFMHSKCKPLIQYGQFLIFLKDGIDRNNMNLINSLESQIAAKFQEFEMAIIKEIQNNLRNLQDQFFDNIQEIFHEIHNYNPINFTQIDNKIINPDFLRYCMSLLDNKINYPNYFYLDDSFQNLNKEFEKLYFEIQSVFNDPKQQPIFQFEQPTINVIKEEPPIIPLKGYKNIEETLNSEKKVNQINEVQKQTIVIQQPQTQQVVVKEQTFKLEERNEQKEPRKKQTTNQQKKTENETNQQVAYVPYDFKFNDTQKKENKPKEKSSNTIVQKQAETKKVKPVPIVPLPSFQVLSEINKFSSDYKQENTQISKTKISALCHKNGTVYLEGFLNKVLSYQVNFLLKYLPQETNLENYFELGLIDCSTFKPPKQLKCLQQGIFSINHQGQIANNSFLTDSQLKMYHECLFMMKFEGKTNTLTFQINQLKV